MKLPFMQFYPNDWLTATSPLSNMAKGAWIDILCFAWKSPERGVYERRDDMAARELRLEFCGDSKCGNEGEHPNETCDFHRVMAELSYVAEIEINNFKVRIESRRMVKEESDRKNNAKYQSNHRSKEQSKDDVRYKKETVMPYISEVRSQKSEVINNKESTPTPAEPQKAAASAPVIFPKDPKALVGILAQAKAMGPGKIETASPIKAQGPYKAPETPLAKFLVGIKILQGFDATDRAWDSVYFKRYGRAAADMLKFFDGDWKAALANAERQVKELNAKGLSWTVETLVRNAPAGKVKSEV